MMSFQTSCHRNGIQNSQDRLLKEIYVVSLFQMINNKKMKLVQKIKRIVPRP